MQPDSELLFARVRPTKELLCYVEKSGARSVIGCVSEQPRALIGRLDRHNALLQLLLNSMNIYIDNNFLTFWPLTCSHTIIVKKMRRKKKRFVCLHMSSLICWVEQQSKQSLLRKSDQLNIEAHSGGENATCENTVQLCV